MAPWTVDFSVGPQTKALQFNDFHIVCPKSLRCRALILFLLLHFFQREMSLLLHHFVDFGKILHLLFSKFHEVTTLLNCISKKKKKRKQRTVFLCSRGKSVNGVRSHFGLRLQAIGGPVRAHPLARSEMAGAAPATRCRRKRRSSSKEEDAPPAKRMRGADEASNLAARRWR